MSTSREMKGRIEEDAEGVGVPTKEQVDERAKELAIIAGRTRVNKADRANARRELAGESEEEVLEEEDSITSWSSTPDAAGHRVDTESPEEREVDVSIGESLVSEGVDEALHDKMLEARRSEEDARRSEEQ